MSRGKRMMMLSGAMGMLMAASMRGANMAFPQNLSSVPLPPYMRDMKRRQRRRMSERQRLRQENRDNYETNRTRLKRLRGMITDEHTAAQAVIKRMSNNQRCRWQRAGADRDPEVLAHFVALSTAKGARA